MQLGGFFFCLITATAKEPQLSTQERRLVKICKRFRMKLPELIGLSIGTTGRASLTLDWVFPVATASPVLRYFAQHSSWLEHKSIGQLNLYACLGKKKSKIVKVDNIYSNKTNTQFCRINDTNLFILMFCKFDVLSRTVSLEI